MVSRSPRKQVNPEFRKPGLSVREALNVPQGQATRRSGVGQNAANMGTALSRLGSALGSLDATIGKDSKFDQHAEKRRIEAHMNTASQRGPEERAAIRQVTGMPASPTREMKQITAFRNDVAPVLAKQLFEVEKGWADNGYALTDPETGEKKEITREGIEEYFKEYLQLNVYDVYGGGEGEEGRLRDPQVALGRKLILDTKESVLRRWSAYKMKEQEREAHEITTKDAPYSLEKSYKSGARSQDLLDDFMESGKVTYNEAYGAEAYKGQKRSEVVENRLRELHRTMKTPGHAKMAIELLEGRLRNKDGSLGATLRESYPQIVPKIIKEAQARFNEELVSQWKERVHAGNHVALGEKGSTFSFETKTFTTDDGKEFTLTKKEQEVFALTNLKKDAAVAAGSDKDPEKKWEEHQRMVVWSAGTPLIDPEVKGLFSNANFGIAAQNESDFGKLMTVYRDIKAYDPTRLNEYVTDASVRKRLHHMDRILKTNPGVAIPDALAMVQKGLDEEGNVVSWSNIPGGTLIPGQNRKQSFSRSFNEFKNNVTDKYNLDSQEIRDLEDNLKMRLVDDYERGRLDADGNGNVDYKEFEKAMTDEATEMMKLRTYVGGQKLTPPVGVNAEGYKLSVEGFMKQLKMQFPGLPEELSIKTIPGNPGLQFVDKKTGKVVDLHWGNGVSGKATFNHTDILMWSKTAAKGAIDAKAIRKGGGAIFRRTAAEQNKLISEATQRTEETRSWLQRTFGVTPDEPTKKQAPEHPAAQN